MDDSTDGWLEEDPSVHEEEPRRMKIGIAVKNLTKSYDLVGLCIE